MSQHIFILDEEFQNPQVLELNTLLEEYNKVKRVLDEAKLREKHLKQELAQRVRDDYNNEYKDEKYSVKITQYTTTKLDTDDLKSRDIELKYIETPAERINVRILK